MIQTVRSATSLPMLRWVLSKGYLVTVGTVFLVLLSLSACAPQVQSASPGATVVQPGAPGQPTQRRSAEELANDSPVYSEFDVEFMQGMIGHHQQALAMTALVESRTQSRDLRLLAERIELTQYDEIALMEAWLERRGEELPESEHLQHMMAGGEMPHGMLSRAEMDQLASASGLEFERLFLGYMIRHHMGAVEMVEQLFGSPNGGQETQVFQFASSVASDQPIEVARMQRMLVQRQ